MNAGNREFSEIRSLVAGLGEERQRVALGERAADTSDEALLDTLSAIDEALIRQNLQDVRDVATARERITAGTYGECIDCGSDILYERLLAYPTPNAVLIASASTNTERLALKDARSDRKIGYGWRSGA